MRSPLCRQRPQGASSDLEVRAVFLRPARPSMSVRADDHRHGYRVLFYAHNNTLRAARKVTELRLNFYLAALRP